MARVLIIDDDRMFSEALNQAVSHLGHETEIAHALEDGLKLAREGGFDAVMLDVRLPDGSGLDVLPLIRRAPSQPEVIIITGEGEADGAELALKSGAWDYIEKPASLNKMTLPLTRALEYRAQRESRKPKVLKRKGLIGSSPTFEACLEQLAEAASGDASVLITGETGTGKEIFARAIHENSARSTEPFVVVDCAALPETLVESVLFGHVKGAFTGAGRDQEGLALQAHKGTLFLDEIGELPLAEQRSFLRVLQERRFRPIGGKRELESDFRLIVATNRTLEDMVERGEFREDLLFRIRAVTIELPPLRRRDGDVAELARFYVARICERMDLADKGFSPDFLEVLEKYSWPGNIRELVATMEKAVLSARYDASLYPTHLPAEMRVSLLRSARKREDSRPASANLPEAGSIPWKEYKKMAMDEMESRYFSGLYERTGGSVKEMARLSELTLARVYGLLKKHGIQSD